MVVPTRAPAGTVAEQRARLPPPAQCEDSIAGIWKSHDFRPTRGVWEIMTLEIRRSDDAEDSNALTGTIVNLFWHGSSEDQEPGRCRGFTHAQVSQNAEGTITDGLIEFHGVGQWRLDQLFCGNSFQYVLDVFEGRFDPERQEFVSVANDGVVAINEPTVFRRIGCLPEDGTKEAPKVVVKAPSFYPPGDTPTGGGCMSR